MRQPSRSPYTASAVLAALMVTQSVLGIVFPGAYRDAEWIRATWAGNDWVTLLAAAPVLIGSLALSRRGSVRGRLLWLGALAYAAYDYAFYALGAALNAFFALYVVLLLLAATTLGAALLQTDVERVARAFRRTRLADAVGVYLLGVALALATVWLAMWAAYAYGGVRAPIEPEAFRLVAALDLTMLVPALATGGLLLRRRHAWGCVIAPAAAVQGALYLLVLTVNATAAVAGGRTPPPGEAPLWGALFVLTAGAAGLLLADAVEEEAVPPSNRVARQARTAHGRAPHGRAPRVLALAGSLVALFLAFLLVVRPWYLRWGATDDETRRPLPGDAIIPNAAGQETRAITIRAPVERVWPWLAQIGQDRGGFYSFDLLENLVGCEMPTADVLRPDRQTWRLGDKLWMYPPNKAGGIGFATLRAYVPGRALGFSTHAPGSSTKVGDGSWTYVVEPLGDSATRLLVRGRGAVGRPLLGVAFDRAVFEPVHFVMERRMMLGVKQLAEEGDRRRLANHAQVLLWTATLAVFVIAGVLVLRRDDWRLPLAAFVAAGAVFQVLTLVQPPVALGALLVAALAAMLRGRPARAAARTLVEVYA